MRFDIIPDPPFNFELTTGVYSCFPSQCVDTVTDGVYKRALEISGKIHLLRVRSVGASYKPKLLVDFIPDIPQRKFVDEKVRWMFGMNDDIGGFYKIALKDRNFVPIIKLLYGLRAPKTPTVFEALIIAISEQQIALPVAIALRKRLVERYGKSIDVGGKCYFAFPSPNDLAKAKPEDIRAMKFNTQKSNYFVEVSKLVASGKLDLEKMRNWDKEKIMSSLTAIKGIGPWTVEYMMARGMGRYDALPATDVGLRNGVAKYLGRDEKVSEPEVRKALEPFSRYQREAAFYLIYNYAFAKYPIRK
jgi:DNA-3-methyladenine glycosylase II